jgi:thiamine pyrophosphate-dependent acetolactate synthase large subunit-like protein
VQVDDDVRAIGLDSRVDVGVLGDCGATAADLVDALGEPGPDTPGWRTPAVAETLRRAPWRELPYDDAGTDDRIDPRTLSIALDDLLPGDRTIVVDGGHFLGFPATYLSVPEPRRFVFSSAGFQSIGLGLGSAVGAAVARPDRPTVVAVGDGGALMSISELETLARLALPVLVVVYNDAAYGAEVHHFGPDGYDLDIVRFPDTDIAAMASAVGADAATVRTPADLAVVDKWLRDGHQGPLVLDAKVVPTVVGRWTEEAFHGH